VRHQLQPVLAQGGIVAAWMTHFVNLVRFNGRRPSPSCCVQCPLHLLPRQPMPTCASAGNNSTSRREQLDRQNEARVVARRVEVQRELSALPSQSSSMRAQFWSWSPTSLLSP